jgi:hypothetical protein
MSLPIANHVPFGYGYAAPLARALEKLTEAQKLFLYAMSTMAPKNQAGNNTEDGCPDSVQFLVKDTLDRAVAANMPRLDLPTSKSLGNLDYIEIAGTGTLNALPIAWQDWLLTDEGQELFKPLYVQNPATGEEYGGGALPGGVLALLHWYRYPTGRDEKRRIIGGCIVMGFYCNRAVHEAFDTHFDQLQPHIQGLFDYVMAQDLTPQERELTRWWAGGMNPHTAHLYFDFSVWPDYEEEIYEPARRSGTGELLRANTFEICAGLYDLLPADLRPPWELARGTTYLPTLNKCWPAHDIASPEHKELARDLYRFDDDYSGCYDGTRDALEEAIWQPWVDRHAAASPEAIARFWKPAHCWEHTLERYLPKQFQKTIYYTSQIWFYVYDEANRRPNFKLPKSPPTA